MSDYYTWYSYLYSAPFMALLMPLLYLRFFVLNVPTKHYKAKEHLASFVLCGLTYPIWIILAPVVLVAGLAVFLFTDVLPNLLLKLAENHND